MADKDRNADYSAAGFGNLLGFGAHPALVIVDFVMAYIEPSSPLYAGADAMLQMNERLLAAARAARIPVIFTNVIYTPGGADGGYFYRKIKALKCFDRGSPLGNFPPTLHPNADEIVVTKQYASAFFGTSLASILVSKAVDTVICTGFSTSGCVRATALDALQHGFIPIVVRDACGDRQTSVHEANLFDLGAKYADVVDTAAVVEYLARYP